MYEELAALKKDKDQENVNQEMFELLKG